MSHNRDKTVNQGNSSFWRRHGSSEDQQSATSGNQDRAQPNPSSAFRSGWGRPDSSNPQASGGGGLRRQPSFFDRPAAVGGGLGRPNGDSNPQASYGGRWGSRHTPIETSSQPPQPAPQPPQRPSRREQLIRDLKKYGIRALPSHLQEKFMTYKIMHEMGFPVEELDDNKLRHLQGLLCTETTGALLAVVAISQYGDSMSIFIQSMKQLGFYTNRNASDITIVYVALTGSRKIVWTVGDQLNFDQFIGVQTVGPGSADCCYSNDPAANYFKQSCAISDLQQDAIHAKSKGKFYPDSADSFENKSSELDPVFQAFCLASMEHDGYLPLPAFSASTAIEMHASSAEVAGEAPVEALMISCYHGNCVKSFDGKYESCQSCLSNPGKDTIVDGWGSVVGYRQEP